ncbi:sigma-70 family RNA polymerase sigma factor [Methylocella sp.]|uniref:sigma-70 family RNA polymerase sigma factor n=1 Tax=Methylocella sp. TaxID=1978226 RepID=UPI00378312C0
MMNTVDAAGSGAALLAAVMTERRQLLSMATRILRCPSLAEDVVQDVAVKASCMAGGGVDCPAQFARCMVRNLSIDRARKRRREVALSAPVENLDAVEREGAGPGESLAARQALRAVFSALDELPERTQLVFRRVRIEGVAQKTVAADLGVSPTLVNFMVQAAHRHCLARVEQAEGAVGAAPAARRLAPRRAVARRALDDGRAGPQPAGRATSAQAEANSSRPARRRSKDGVTGFSTTL